MRNMLLSTVAAVAISVPALAQDGGAVGSAVDTGIEMLDATGTEVTIGSREVGADNSLTLRDVRLAPNEGDVVIEAGFIKLTPSTETAGDVEITLSDEVNISITPEPGMDPIEIVMASENFALVTNWVLGAAGAPSFKVSADAFSVTGGDPEHPVLKSLNISPARLDITGSFDEATRNAEASFSLPELKMEYSIVDPLESGAVSTSVDSEYLNMTFTAQSLPSGEEDIAAFLSDGSMRLSFEGGPATSSFSSDTAEMPVSMESKGEAGSALITVEDGVFAYLTEFGAVDYQVTPNPQIMPFPPFSVSINGGLVQLQSPVAPTDSAREMKVAMTLDQLTIDDALWSLFDAAGAIPRDPLQLELDVTAMLQLDRPLTEAEGVDNPLEMGKVESVDINRLFVSGGGATVQANGGATMDYSVGIPMPTGAVDISVEGVQGLANKLVQMGLIEQMQVGMVMGMMMAFAEQTGPDAFSSKIEFKDGGITANGQPIQ